MNGKVIPKSTDMDEHRLRLLLPHDVSSTYTSLSSSRLKPSLCRSANCWLLRSWKWESRCSEWQQVKAQWQMASGRKSPSNGYRSLFLLLRRSVKPNLPASRSSDRAFFEVCVCGFRFARLCVCLGGCHTYSQSVLYRIRYRSRESGPSRGDFTRTHCECRIISATRQIS